MAQARTGWFERLGRPLPRSTLITGAAVLVLLLGPFAPSEAHATPPEPGVPESAATAVAVGGTVTIDGRLDDALWQGVAPTTGFRQREPREGAEATFPTEFRVAFDERALYVAVTAIDPEPGKIVGLLTRRDVESPSDWIMVFVDSWHDRLTAFEFGVNPAGVRRDRYWFNDTSADDGWDAVWDVAVGTDERGWTAEFRIPLSQLRFRSVPDGRFGFAVVRQVARLNEVSSWPLLPRSAQGFVSSFGQLTNLALGRAANRLELVPYSVAELDTEAAEPGNTLVDPQDFGGQVGLDLKYALKPGVTMTATVNPDFGQVEADPAVVNLSAFETFFDERRPFFLEGSGIFRFDIDCNDGQCSGLFYSRRIGRAPRGEPDVPDDGFISGATETTIFGAAKLTGRAGNFSFGALNALTADERATVLEPNGARTTSIVEPATSYTVLRTRREWTNQSSLGAMFTAANRGVPTELQDLLPTSAYALGVDGDWRLSRRYRLNGFWAGSSVSGDPLAIQTLQEDNRHLYQRPDATHLTLDPTRTFLRGQAGSLAFSKNGGERVRFTSNWAFKTPGFEINELGFLRRADERQISNWLQLRHDRPWHFLRMARLNLNQWVGWNFGGDRLEAGGNVNVHFQFLNNWRTGAGLTRLLRTFDDRLTRGGPGGYTDPAWAGWGYVGTDDRRLVSGEIQGFRRRDSYGNSVWEFAPRVVVRPSSALSASAGLLLSRNRDAAQWVEEVEGDTAPHYVFGNLDQQTTAVTLRVNYALSPTLSLQLYGRPFVSTGRYAGYSELVDGRAKTFADRYAPYAYGDNADFGYLSFRTTNVLRWEFRPGSTLFVVWQQGREDDEAAPFTGRHVGDAFSAPAHNVFLVKFAYWMNP